eukprot:scaffold201889_cov31-Attheya_sp.AAC.1
MPEAQAFLRAHTDQHDESPQEQMPRYDWLIVMEPPDAPQSFYDNVYDLWDRSAYVCGLSAIIFFIPFINTDYNLHRYNAIAREAARMEWGITARQMNNSATGGPMLSSHNI